MSTKNPATKKKFTPIFTEDPALAQREREEEKAREEAFQAEPEWNGQPLEWTISKESLFYSLRQSVGAPEITTVIADIDAFLADAIRIIYLSLHSPADWRAHRPNMITWQEHIDQWADKNIAQNQRVELIVTAWKLLDLAGANRHEPATDPTQPHTPGK